MAFLFYALRNDLNRQAAPEIDNRAYDSIIARIALHISDETAVDFNNGHRKLLEMTQGGIASSKIVQSNLDPGRIKRC